MTFFAAMENDDDRLIVIWCHKEYLKLFHFIHCRKRDSEIRQTSGRGRVRSEAFIGFLCGASASGEGGCVWARLFHRAGIPVVRFRVEPRTVRIDEPCGRYAMPAGRCGAALRRVSEGVKHEQNSESFRCGLPCCCLMGARRTAVPLLRTKVRDAKKTDGISVGLFACLLFA